MALNGVRALTQFKALGSHLNLREKQHYYVEANITLFNSRERIENFNIGRAAVVLYTIHSPCYTIDCHHSIKASAMFIIRKRNAVII